MHQSITVEQAKALTEPTKDFLCKPEDNIYDIEFILFKIRNPDDNQILFEIKKPESEIGKKVPNPTRYVQYHFGPQFFKLKRIGTTLDFKVGEKPVKQFKMLEKHYFKGTLIRQYQFDVPFCMPNGRNSMEAIYDLPEFPPEVEEEMIKCPYETVSDSFYFVEGDLVMHNKAAYSYAPFQQ